MDSVNNQSQDHEFRSSDNQSISPDHPGHRPSPSALAPILSLVPLAEFRRLSIAPVSFNEGEQQLKLLCSTSVDEALRSEFSSRLPNVKLEWYHGDDEVIAVMFQRLEETLLTAGDAAHNDSTHGECVNDRPSSSNNESAPLVSEVPAAAPTQLSSPSENGSRPTPAPECGPTILSSPASKVVLFVAPAGKISAHLSFALNAERLTAVTVNNQDQAAVALEEHPVVSVYIHENLVGRCEHFIARLQTDHPDTPVRHYRSEAGILLNDTRNPATFDLLRQNLSLFGRLSNRQGYETSSHAASVAKLADRMMVRMGVPDQCRLMVTTAAYLHNIAEENLTTSEGLAQTDIIRLSASKLESWGYPAPILGMLRRMYRGFGEAGLANEGTEVTAASILTAADLFCHQWPDPTNVGRQMDVVQRRIEDQLQWKVMPSIISTLVDVVCDDCTARMLRPDTFRVHLFVSRGQTPTSLIDTMRDAGIVVSVSTSLVECSQNCRQAKAEMLVVFDNGTVPDLYDTLMSLALRGVAIDQLHTMLLVDFSLVGEMMRLLPHGVEEILPSSARSEAIVTKLGRLKNRLEEQYRHRVSAIERLGTHGSLGDISLTDVLEIWRSHRRPARLSVTAFGNQLTVFLDKGKVVSAECGECEGMAALLRGVSWRQGIWNIDSIEASELPPPNIDQSIDGVLIEACTRLDEVVRSEPSYGIPTGAH